MKKHYTLVILLLLSLNSFSQKNEFYEMMKYPKVSINEKLIAYTTTYQKKENGIKHEEQMNNPNVNNPYYISIISEDGFGQLKVRNGYYENSVVINFNLIYKNKEDGQTWYYFITDNPNYEVTYIDVKGSKDILFININEDKNNGVSLSYAISQI